MEKRFEFDAVIHEIPEKGGAYIVFPWNIREVFGKGLSRYTLNLTVFHMTAALSTWV